jgi:autotransporter strand-loop-strand O-heptosyltransferase
MNKRGLEVYTDLKKSKSVRFRHPITFDFYFDYGPKADCIGPSNSKPCMIKFKDLDHDRYAYNGETSPGLYTQLYRKWYTNWRLEAFDGDDLIFQKDLDDLLMGGKVCISIDSSSLGDTLAWMPVVERFRVKYGCDLYATTFWNELLANYYPDIRFKPPGYRESQTNATIGVGWYDEDDLDKHKRDPRTISLQQVAGDILGIEVEEDVLNDNVPLTIRNSKPTIDGKYVCIAMDSTANAKHWHYDGGWQKIVDYLNSIGYKVVVVQKQATGLSGIIDKTGDIDILQRAIDIYHADFFIGIGSGLSWLAWSLHKPVIMISGFSDPFCEFSTKNYRIINRDVCHGCFSDPSIKFDKGDWNWCPRLKDTERMFECTKTITPEVVQKNIEALIIDHLS